MNQEQFLNTILKAQEAASIDQVFGKPTTEGERTIIPVASLSYMFGLGWGGGPQSQDAQGRVTQEGSGAGGGGRVKGRPVAVIEITKEGTRVVPIEDRTRLMLMCMAVCAWSIFWVTATFRKLIAAKK